MATHAPPSDEIARVAALTRYRVFDSSPDGAFDDLVHVAAALYGVPIAVLTFIDQDRQWFKATVGLPTTQTPRSSGLCTYTVQQGELVAIEDAQADPRFSSHPLVASDPGVRFYCGAPIITPDGFAVGTIAVMDTAPRRPTDEQCQALRRLARQATAQLELRRTTHDRSASEDSAMEEMLASMADAVFVTDPSGRVLRINRGAETLLHQPSSALLGRLLDECVHRHEQTATPSPEERCRLVNACAAQSVVQCPEDVFVSHDGSGVLVSWIAAPFVRGGDLRGTIVSVRNRMAEKRNEEALHVMGGASRATGVTFLQELVETLTRSLGATYGFCMRPLQGRQRAQSVVGYGPEGRLPPMEYDLAKTPCEHVLSEEFCHYPHAVQTAFPQDALLRQFAIESYMALTLPSPTGEPVGWIALLSTKPLEDAAWAESLLRLAAGRAGSELGRYLAEVQLKESEERYALALRGTSDGIWDWNVLTGEVVHSTRWKALLGFGEDELPNHVSAFLDRLHPDDVARVQAETQRHFAQREPFDVQCRLRHKDGRYRWMQSRAQALWDEQGRPYRMVGAMTDITERKEAEEDARRWQQVFDQAEFGLAHADLTSETFTAVNRAFARQCGYAVDELIGRPVLSVYPPEERAAVQERCLQIDQTGHLMFESTQQRKDGSIFPVLVEAMLIRDAKGRPHSRVAHVKDITELKQAEAERQEGDLHLSLALEAAGEGTFDWNQSANRTHFCARGLEIFGFRPGDVTSYAACLERIHPEDRQWVAQRFEDCMRTQHDFEAEYRLRLPSGEERWVMARGRGLSGPQGHVGRTIGVLLDVTERKRVEDALRRSEERFRAAYRNATVGMSIADDTGRLREVNQTLCTILGYSEEELLTRTYQSVTHPEDLGQNLERVRSLWSGELACDVFEKRYIRKDGRIIWAHVGLSVIRDEAGRALHVLAMVQDITERKRTEEALQLAKYTVDHATEAIYWVGSGAELLDVNEAASLMLGYSREEFLGMTVHDLNPLFTREHWPSYWQETREKERVSFEGTHRAKDGRLIPIEVDVNFMYYNGSECHCAFVRDVTERKRSEGALLASQERFHFAIEATNEGLWDWNIETDAVYYSPQWIRLLGYPPEDVTGSTAFFFRILHPDDHSRLAEVMQAHLDGHTPVKELELRLRHKSGEYRWYLDRGKVVARDAQGQPLRMVGTITDITERNRVERERTEALANLQTIMETVPDVIFVLDLEGRLSKWNRRLETVTGYTCDELLGKSALEMVPTAEAEPTTAAIRQAFEQGYAELEGHLLTKDGRTLPYHWNGATFADLHGRVVGISGVGRDITERKQTEALLRSSEERFRFVALATNDILWDWDLLTGDHWWSPNACDKFGYDSGKEPSVDAWSSRLHPEDRERVLDIVSRAIQTDVRTFSAEYRFQLADGTYGYFLDRAHIVRNDSGVGVRMIGAMIDVTAPRRAYASLEEAYHRFQAMSQELHMVESNERRRLSRELHDEFGQLLTSLKFDLASVKRYAARSRVAGESGQERLARALDTIDLLFARLRQIVRALRPPVLEELGLKASLEALIADVQARTGLRCSLVFEQKVRRGARLPTLETAFYRIVQELLTNVIRHAHATTVSIVVQRSRQEWQLTVHDDGVGFDVGRLSPMGGFGLRGIRERVEILAGQVEISSGAGSGTTVQVRLPVGSSPDTTTREGTPSGSASRRRKSVHE
ncbi:MAG: PAS domain S-box protein [Nitrospira sp.]|nr:PAS domain S-box protein [Nitrospira sp.]